MVAHCGLARVRICRFVNGVCGSGSWKRLLDAAAMVEARWWSENKLPWWLTEMAAAAAVWRVEGKLGLGFHV